MIFHIKLPQLFGIVKNFSYVCTMIYAVEITEGMSHEIYSYIHFVTHDKALAERWVERFNKIIDDNRDRVTEAYNRDEDCFWCDWIVYENPHAEVREIEYRDGKDK